LDGRKLLYSDAPSCTCVPEERINNPCDLDFYLNTLTTDAERQDYLDNLYDPEQCPYIEGGINFVGCEKWMRTFVDGNWIWDIDS